MDAILSKLDYATWLLDVIDDARHGDTIERKTRVAIADASWGKIWGETALETWAGIDDAILDVTWDAIREITKELAEDA